MLSLFVNKNSYLNEELDFRICICPQKIISLLKDEMPVTILKIKNIYSI